MEGPERGGQHSTHGRQNLPPIVERKRTWPCPRPTRQADYCRNADGVWRYRLPSRGGEEQALGEKMRDREGFGARWWRKAPQGGPGAKSLHLPLFFFFIPRVFIYASISRSSPALDPSSLLVNDVPVRRKGCYDEINYLTCRSTGTC